MILYYGSNVEVREPRLLKVQRELDFGKGFYTTSDLEQAAKWARRTVLRLHRKDSYISVYEVDETEMSHLRMLEVCTIGVSHPERVEVAKSFVALCPGAACTATELIDYCRQNLTAYKVPTEIAIIDQLPRTSAGKPNRIALRKREGKLCR